MGGKGRNKKERKGGWCAALAPHGIKDAFRESMNDIRKAWDEQLKKKKKAPDLKPVES